MDYETLLDEVKAGKRIPTTVLDGIRDQLLNETFEGDPYTLIHILGKCNDRKSVGLIEKYIAYDSDNPEYDGMIRRIALQVYGQMWRMREAFSVARERAFQDPSPYVQAAAATTLGTLGRVYTDLRTEAARLLLDGFSRREAIEPEVWESFHDGLLELFDVPAVEWPNAAKEMTENQIRWDVVAKARELVAGSQCSASLNRRARKPRN